MNDIVKKENRKALPRFLGMLLLAMLLGGALGFASAFAAEGGWKQTLETAASALLTAIAPWGIPVFGLVFHGLSIADYRRAKALAAGWDGEDEELMERVDERLNRALVWSSLLLLVNFFFFSLCALYITSLWALGTVALFFLSCCGIIILHQKVVDLTRRLNPEKQGSVYERNFKKKWLESCDEAEQRMIGQAAFKAYSAMNAAFPVAWCILTVLNFFFGIGLLPIVVVLVLWGISSMSYQLEAMKLGRRKEG